MSDIETSKLEEALVEANIELVEAVVAAIRKDGIEDFVWSPVPSPSALAKLEQAARDFAAAEADELWERWYRHEPPQLDPSYAEGRRDGHERLLSALRAGGLAQKEKE